jgi:CHAT domain-containing protein
VQYQYSTALLNREKDDLSGAGALSFAPFTTKAVADTFAALPHSKTEILALDGNRFFDTAATKKKFLLEAERFPVLHLATHAVVNDKAENLSYIAFSPADNDHLLYAREIYNLSLRRTRLVILSACETGTGQLIRGEGVMSLSRAFRYAGCPNVITTLWKADDFSTAYLTTRVHHYLSRGLPVSQSLQQAKSDYLGDRTIHPRMKHPYYWSHLVFIGNVQEEESNWWKWLAGVMALAGLSFFLSRSRKRRLKK